jgi:hypothetical protein
VQATLRTSYVVSSLLQACRNSSTNGCIMPRVAD